MEMTYGDNYNPPVTTTTYMVPDGIRLGVVIREITPSHGGPKFRVVEINTGHAHQTASFFTDTPTEELVKMFPTAEVIVR